ncbi:uncharacterized protein LOC118450966 [Vespa mandarinia]|uniref:uncharacterized protein LOC118450966 n=1 Tax=Vespa mandarinia TaxID=7446 RepID=UPI00160DD825|nr:uncharacterized protein LOC118450966 [Vespa mandarinia]
MKCHSLIDFVQCDICLSYTVWYLYCNEQGKILIAKMNFCGKEKKKIRKILRDCDLTDDDQNLVSEESDVEADSFSADSEATQRRKKKRLIVSSEETLENIDDPADDDGASCSPTTKDNERIIDDDDMWYDNKKKLIEFAFNDGKCGIKMNADKYSSAKNIFDQLFSRNVVETLVSCTNEYGKYLFETKHSSNFVLRLMQPCLGKGHHLFMDNFYNSIELSRAANI